MNYISILISVRISSLCFDLPESDSEVLGRGLIIRFLFFRTSDKLDPVSEECADAARNRNGISFIF